MELCLPHEKAEQFTYGPLPADEHKVPIRSKQKSPLHAKSHVVRPGYQRRCIVCQQSHPGQRSRALSISPTARRSQTVHPNKTDSPTQPFQKPGVKLDGTDSTLEYLALKKLQSPTGKHPKRIRLLCRCKGRAGFSEQAKAGVSKQSLYKANWYMVRTILFEK